MTNRTTLYFNHEKILFYLVFAYCLFLQPTIVGDNINIWGAVIFFSLWVSLDLIQFLFINFESFCGILKKVVFLTIVFFLVLAPLKNRINEKNDFDYTHVSDGSLQTEYAVELLSKGRNIYSEDVPQGFFGLSGTHHDFVDEHGQKVRILNPAYFHYIYPPAFTLQSLPFYYLTMKLGGWFDQRIILIVYYLITLALLLKMLSQSQVSEDLKYLMLSLSMLNPFFLEHFLGGRNDIVIFFWILLTFELLKRDKASAAIFSIAIACLMKQTAWIIAPFVYIYLFHRWSLDGKLNKNKPIVDFLIKVSKISIIPALLSIIVFLPFIIWDASGLWTDMFLYPSGKLPTSYPVNGYSLLAFLVGHGYLGSFLDYYPTMARIQFFAYLGMLVWSYFRIRNNIFVSRLVLQTTLTLVVFLFFSRFCQGNYAELTLKFLIITWIFKKSESLKGN